MILFFVNVDIKYQKILYLTVEYHMSSLLRQSKGPQMTSYIATANFANSFFTYTPTKNNLFQVSYTLGPVTADPSKTPIGTILRETGKKLYPGVDSVSTFMIGVYDQNTTLSGFIDPNAAVFAPYNLNKPVTVGDGVDPSTGIPDAGPSVYTNGTLVPANPNVDLGSLEHPFRHLYVSSQTIFLGSAKISSDTSGNIIFTNKSGAKTTVISDNARTLVAVGDAFQTVPFVLGLKKLLKSYSKISPNFVGSNHKETIRHKLYESVKHVVSQNSTLSLQLGQTNANYARSIRYSTDGLNWITANNGGFILGFNVAYNGSL